MLVVWTRSRNGDDVVLKRWTVSYDVGRRPWLLTYAVPTVENSARLDLVLSRYGLSESFGHLKCSLKKGALVFKEREGIRLQLVFQT
jgi:hypothetical protein